MIAAEPACKSKSERWQPNISGCLQAPTPAIILPQVFCSGGRSEFPNRSIRDGQAATTRPGRSEDYHLHCARATTQCVNWCGCSRGRTERHTYIMVASCKWLWADVTPLRLELGKVARRRAKSQLGDPVRLYTGSASTAIGAADDCIRAENTTACRNARRREEGYRDR